MIRVHKSDTVPESLSRTKAYDGEDVKIQLYADQLDKCYICERVRDTDTHIEHCVSRKGNAGLVQEWDNLFLSCSYCNGKKLNHFDNILNPAECNIEDEIQQAVTYLGGQVTFVFTPMVVSDAHDETVRLLSLVHNGKDGVRKIKEKKFLNCVMSSINSFNKSVFKYLQDPTSDNEDEVRGHLTIDKEYLGLKYWIVKNNPALYNKFATDIVWNKK